MPTTGLGITYPASTDHARLWEHLQTLAANVDALLTGRYDLATLVSAWASADLTTSTTETDITGATVTFSTAHANALYRVDAMFDVSVTAADAGGAIVQGRISVDGATLGNSEAHVSELAIARATVNATNSGTLAAVGSHTIKLRALKTSAAGTSAIRNPFTGLTVAVYEPYA